MHDLIGTLGRVYSLAWWLLYQLANPLVLWGVIVLIAFYYWLSWGDPLLGFPYMVLLAMASYVSRFVLKVLPIPSVARTNFVPTEKPMPPSAHAVIVAPESTPEACPDAAGMVARLPENVRALIR